ncbi:MAG TPA: TasA family protein [Acidimicrobiia bacterium]|nr:TasA family protein [Acidimicrobiia bacterium]
MEAPGVIVEHGRTGRTRRLFRSHKLLWTLVVLGVTAAAAGMGTYATFTSTTSASQSVSSAQVTIALGATGASTNRLTVSATGVVAGDTIQRSFDLANSGGSDLATIAMTTTASPSSLLDSDAVAGLQMVIDKCSVPWTEAGTSPAFTYTCGGTSTTIIASRAVIGSSLAMPGLAALTNGATDHLRLTLTLPSTSGNTF